MEKLNVAIADDNERIVELLDRIVSSDEELNVVGKAGNGEEALRYHQGKRAGCGPSGYYYAESGRTDGDGAGEPKIKP